MKLNANSIHPSIQVEIDYPSRYSDFKLPILDLKVWPFQHFNEVTQTNDVYILHEYYHKDVSSKAVIHVRSAIPWKAKRVILTQEILRIMRNCSTKLPWNNICAHVSEFSARMQFSGYDQRFRAEVVWSALKAYETIRFRNENGEQPMYRPREWKPADRVEARRAKKTNWFKQGSKNNETMIFVPATPGGALKKQYLKVVERANMKVTITEIPGTTLRRRLQRSDPFCVSTCKDRRCMVCRDGSGDGGGRCRMTGVTYKIM